jgi:hypothetical protein
LECVWESFNAAREARFAADAAEVAAAEKKAAAAKYVENSVTADICDTVRFWVSQAKEQAEKEGVEFSKADAATVVKRAVARACGDKVY